MRDENTCPTKARACPLDWGALSGNVQRPNYCCMVEDLSSTLQVSQAVISITDLEYSKSKSVPERINNVETPASCN